MLRIATYGAGWVSTHRHIPSLQRHRGVKLVGVLDRHLEHAQAAAAPFRGLAGTDLDARWMRDVDAVVIGTPPETHHALVLAALGCGLHVLVEKPFAMSAAQANEMIEAAQRAKRTLAVVHNFQFARSVAAARRRFDDGEAGELRGVYGLQFSSHDRRLPIWYRTLPCGLFFDEAPHLFYLLKSFLPEFMVASAHVSPSVNPDDRTPRLVSTTHDAGRCVGSIQMFFDTPISEWQLFLMGSREMLVADIFRDILVRIPHDGRHESRDILRTSLASVGGHVLGTFTSGVRHVTGTLDYGNDEVLRRFVAAVQSGDEPRGISASDGLEVVTAMQHVLEVTGDFGNEPSGATG